MTDAQRLEAGLRALDEANSRDPNQVEDEHGRLRPRQLLHAERLSAWVRRLDPDPSPALQLAAQSQHLERWTIPREDYPPGRLGYKQWRSRLARFHAQRASELLCGLGFGDDLVAQVAAINLKTDIKGNPDTQTVEDALCLLFLEHQLGALAEKTADRRKLSEILAKTWQKMSPRGQELALELEIDPQHRQLLHQALAPERY